jgi:hypothetical protein
VAISERFETGRRIRSDAQAALVGMHARRGLSHNQASFLINKEPFAATFIEWGRRLFFVVGFDDLATLSYN